MTTLWTYKLKIIKSNLFLKIPPSKHATRRKKRTCERPLSYKFYESCSHWPLEVWQVKLYYELCVLCVVCGPCFRVATSLHVGTDYWSCIAVISVPVLFISNQVCFISTSYCVVLVELYVLCSFLIDCLRFVRRGHGVICCIYAHHVTLLFYEVNLQNVSTKAIMFYLHYLTQILLIIMLCLLHLYRYNVLKNGWT